MIELMVMLVVLAIVTSMVTLSFSAPSGYALDSTAERLSSALEAARWQAISTGRRIAWEAPQASSSANNVSPEPRWYEQTPEGVWHLRVTAATDSPLTGVTASIVLPRAVTDTPARLVLGPEPVGAAACVLLTQDSSTVAVVSDGVAPFSVRRDARC